MICVECRGNMAQTRYEPGQYKVFTCERCKYAKKKHSDGYSGQVIINPRIPLYHDEANRK